MLQVLCDLAHFDVDLVANRGHRLDVSRGLAVGTRRADGPFQRLLYTFSRDRHQAKIVELKHLRWRAVVAEFLFESLHHTLAVTALVHIDEVDDDDAAQIAQTHLAHDLLDGVDVRLHDGVFEASGFANVLSGVDVDRDQRLGLIDDDVATALQPDFRFERFVDFLVEAELIIKRRLFGIKFDALHQPGLKAIRKSDNALVFLLGVNPDHGEVGTHLIAQDAFDYIEIVIDQSRSLTAVRTGFNLAPEIFQKADVGAQFLICRSRRSGANDETAAAVLALALDDSL